MRKKIVKRVLVELDDIHADILKKLIDEEGLYSQANAVRTALRELYKNTQWGKQ